MMDSLFLGAESNSGNGEKLKKYFQPLGTPTPAFEQQSFLDTTIKDWTCSAGFGDNASTLSVNLVPDEFNNNDTGDNFDPPSPGAPLFFIFGSQKSTINESFINIYNDIYGKEQLGGNNHFAFGGILQAINETIDMNGNPAISCSLTDPREVLSNVSLILNNYAGTTFGNDNLLNIYGFLEFNTPDDFNPLGFGTFTGLTNANFFPAGNDMFSSSALNVQESLEFGGGVEAFPITGTGFSRRCPQGIPYFRVAQAINALSGFYGDVPEIYKDAGFGGFIKFRGYNYMVDLSGLPKLDPLFFIDYDQMSLLDLCLEICEVSNTELFVSLLPVIDHPSSNFLFERFGDGTVDGAPLNGIIRVDGIDRSAAQDINAISTYLSELPDGTNITQKSLGNELTSVTTDKFVVGANEVEMYFFHGYNDRNPTWAKRYTLDYTLTEEILPYYGTLPRKIGSDSRNSKIVTLPKGLGAYQQIMLDATSLNAVGVGNFYVATELELRSALVGFKRWSDFLIDYDNVYMESTEPNDVEEGAALQAAPPNENLVHHPRISNNYAVSVPRSVWPNDGSNVGCNPNYGYPLYYGRASAIGLPSSSSLAIGNATVQAVEQEAQNIGIIIENVKNGTVGDQFGVELSTLEKDRIIKGLKFVNQNKRGKLAQIAKVADTLDRQGLNNAKKVFEFVKGVAEECLGKKFLVKIPQKVNINYDKEITRVNGKIVNGPFGFPPRNITTGGYIRPSLTDAVLGNSASYVGALEYNFNPITLQYEFSYLPESQGGYYEYDLLSNFSTAAEGKKPLHVSQGIAPADATLFDLGNSRTSTYVRFDNAQHLLFGSLNPDDVTLQVDTAGYSTPDLSYTLDNLSPGKQHSVPVDSRQKQIAFVKASVDSEYYMAPEVEVLPLKVYGGNVNFNWTLSPEKKIYNSDTCEEETAIGYSYAQPIPLQTAGPSCSVLHFKATTENGLTVMEPNEDHIYCLITLPSRVEPSIDSRLRDGPLQSNNTLYIKHYLGADVVRGVCGFDTPALRGTPTDLGREYQTPPLGTGFFQALAKVRENKTFVEAGKRFTPGSPVFPDLVAIPLLSRERCYGPWNTNNGGGKVEFDKDENLAPWNFNGFDGMDKAGSIKSGLTTGALLSSGRGAFQLAGVPFGGVFLGKAISSNGPLVSNINVSVGAAGVTTDYELSLYTMKFGKIQKQRGDNISRITRQQQRIKDERNAAIRKGFGKGQSGNVDVMRTKNALGNVLRSLDNSSAEGASAGTPPRHEIISIMPQLDNYRPGGFQANPNNFGSSSSVANATNNEVHGAMVSDDDFHSASQEFNGDFGRLNQVGYNSASNTVGQGRVPISLEPGHPNMTSRELPSRSASQELYFKRDNISSSKIATWGQTKIKGGNDGAV
tara:strand:- start:7572 stop:11729 length:4158 start_codon:yes stop_codon:yes gene_type:complete